MKRYELTHLENKIEATAKGKEEIETSTRLKSRDSRTPRKGST